MDKCYLCDSSELELFKKGNRGNSEIDILLCQACGLHQLNSFSHISDDYYRDSKMHNNNYDLWNKICMLDDDRRTNTLKSAFLSKNILDFGSGSGGFSFNIKKYVNKIIALDIDSCGKDEYDKHGVTFIQDIKQMEKNTFDYITMFHVLEHLKDPVSKLKELAHYLKEDGSFYIEVPNSNDALLSLYKSNEFLDWTAWECHLFMYSDKNLTEIANQAGLCVDYIQQIQRYPLSNHMWWVQKGKSFGHNVYDFLNTDDIKMAYGKTLSQVGACDTLFAKFSKKPLHKK